ncbi:GGDEF domain-containing protein [Bosea sp. BIWAKO-01]|uniref:GGDEF domain-containing protein n=1 Tax=Bosea sp. BIWAKO-01 TaxID=506668 RepID=UPI000852C1F3|nr:GGDEF domain-containing protein [Bosea sp. BIWAKO-01]GAU85824.1 diguanylate cyclase/phosphodiesterase [Bosea sp. BIWAKO-01]
MRGQSVGGFASKAIRASRKARSKIPSLAALRRLAGETQAARILQLELELREARQRLDEMTRLAHIDALSGLANRRAFDDEMRRTVDRAARYGTAAAVAIFDIDRFKAINDLYGHGVGDGVIVAVAQCLRSQVRASDFVARTGGDEFAIILANIDLEGARLRAERLREAVGRLEYRLGDVVIPVPVSVGVSAIEPNKGQCALHEADQAMYRQKRASRTIYVLG